MKKATDLIPNLYDDDTGSEDGSIESEVYEDDVDDLKYDVYNLLATSYHTLRAPGSSGDEKRDEIIHEKTERAAQLLLNKIFSLPSENSDAGPVVTLPAEVTRLPRGKRIPDPPVETKWEKFAKEKGIQKKKKERMVWDEETQTYRPRYGYKSKQSHEAEYKIHEFKKGEDIYSDPFAADREAKKTRVQKNLVQQAKNQERAEIGRAKLGGKQRGKQALASASFSPMERPGIPMDLEDRKAKRGKQGVRNALQLVQRSTASMGRFDESRRFERS